MSPTTSAAALRTAGVAMTDGVGARLVPGLDLIGTPVDLGFTDGISTADLLDVVASLEALTGWVAYASSAVLSALVARLEAEYVRDPAAWNLGHATPADLETARHEATSVLADEVALAAGVGFGQAWDRVEFAAADPDRAGWLREQLREGLVPWYRVKTLHHDCQDLPAREAEDVARAVLAPMRDGTTPSTTVFRARLRRQLATRLGPRRRESIVADRDARVVIDPDGRAHLGVQAPSERVGAAFHRVDATARRLRRDGDRRTLAQLRADVALDLLTFGDLPAGHEHGYAVPPAQVHVVVSLATLLGVTDAPGDSDELGCVPAPLARTLAMAAGSTWRRLVIDDTTGTALELSTTTYPPPTPPIPSGERGSYQPSPRVRQAVVARDRVCRAPGCVVPATGCDLDHDIDYTDGGATSVANLSAKHRRHHQHKTSKLWSTTQDPDGVITWTTWAGRTYTTYPYDYRDHLQQQAPTTIEAPTLVDVPGTSPAPRVDDPTDSGIHIKQPPRPRHRDDDGLGYNDRGQPDLDSLPAWDDGPSNASVNEAWQWIRHHYAVLLDDPPF